MLHRSPLPRVGLKSLVFGCVCVLSAAVDGGMQRPSSAAPPAPTTKAGPFTVTVDRVRSATGRLHTKFDFSRASMNAISEVFSGRLTSGNQAEILKFADSFVPGIADQKPAAQPPNAALPNLAIDLIVDAPPDPNLVYEISSNGRATDDRGRTLESLNIGLYGIHRMSDDPYGPGRGTILLIQHVPGARRLEQLHGELLVGPGRMHRFLFQGERVGLPSERKSGDMAVRLETIEHEQGRLRVAAAVSGLQLPKNPFNPTEAFTDMAKSMVTLDLVILGSDRKAYYWEQMSGGGGLSGSSQTSFSSSSGGKTVQTSQVTTGENKIRYEFVYSPLPRKVSISAIEATLMIHDGETRRIPFALQNVPIPFPNKADK